MLGKNRHGSEIENDYKNQHSDQGNMFPVCHHLVVLPDIDDAKRNDFSWGGIINGNADSVSSVSDMNYFFKIENVSM